MLTDIILTLVEINPTLKRFASPIVWLEFLRVHFENGCSSLKGNLFKGSSSNLPKSNYNSRFSREGTMLEMGGVTMKTKMTMIYWKSEKFWLGKLLDHPEIMTQGETLEELEENMKDAYLLMAMEDVPEEYQIKEIAI